MSDDLAIVPHTGEALPIRQLPLADLARCLDETREWERASLADFKRLVQDEILRRMDSDASWTARAGGFKVSGDSPDRHEWDVDALLGCLDNLECEGLISPEALSRAIKVETVYKPSASGLNALLKLGGDVRERLEQCRVPSSRPRVVRVSRELP